MNGPMKGDFLLMGGVPTGGLAGRHRPLAGFEMRRDVALPPMCEAYSRFAARPTLERSPLRLPRGRRSAELKTATALYLPVSELAKES
jgi:hypothetical protein